MSKRALIASVLVLVLLAGVADAQTTISPTDQKQLRNFLGSIYTAGGTVVGDIGYLQYRMFFEFDFSGYASASTAAFNFSARGISPGRLYLRSMTSGEDGTVSTGDWSLVGSPIWTGSFATTNLTTLSFSVPVTSWFNNRVGGFGGLALTSNRGLRAGIQGAQTLDYTPVPEPGTLALFGLGLASLFVGHRVRRRRRRA